MKKTKKAQKYNPLHPFLALIIIGGLITTNLWLYFNL